MTYEWQGLERTPAGDLVSSRDPRQCSWGYYARDVCTLAPVGPFLWFSSVDELLAFLVEVEPVGYLDGKDEELAGIRNALRPVCDKYRGQAELPPEFIDQVNDVLLSYISIEWAGTFADLRNGLGSEFARDMLEQFRERQDEDVETDAPVTEDELDHFVQRLADKVL